MDQTVRAPRRPRRSSGLTLSEQFTPKLVTTLREGYDLSRLRVDALAGLTVAIVALPLSMAIAIASGASPAQGLITSIIGGFLVSALGGSRFQVGGPAGAFIVLVGATVHTHGMDGLWLAMLLSGAMLAAVGFLRLGTYIKFVPYPVTVGFTAGIAVIIFASQLKDLLGLTLAGPEPGPLLHKLPAIWHALPTFNGTTIGLAAATIIIIQTLKIVRPDWPGLLVAVAGISVFAFLLKLPTATIGTAFGGISGSIPAPRLPPLSWAKAVEVFPAAVSFTLLGAIESLLSAVVADGMSGRRHRSNCELVAQGAANAATALFGGICVTGTIARTATNVRAGAVSPVAGMLHAGFLLVFVLVAAPLASFIPLASLAGVLAIVAWNMVEKPAIATLLRASRGDAIVLIATFGLTIFRDLTEAIVVGFALGSVLFIHRMSQVAADESATPLVADDQADGPADAREPYFGVQEGGIVTYRISGAFFFGAAASIGGILDRIADVHRVLILDVSLVPFIDSTGAHTIEGLVRKSQRKGVSIIIAGASEGVRRDLSLHRIDAPDVRFAASREEGQILAERLLAQPRGA